MATSTTSESKENAASIKSHEEILEMFEELESFEHDITPKPLRQEDREPRFEDIPLEITSEPEIKPVIFTEVPSEEIQFEEVVDKKVPKRVKLRIRRRSTGSQDSDISFVEKQERSTFTLTPTESGNLKGFALPLEKQDQKSTTIIATLLNKVRRGKIAETESGREEKGGKFAKLKGIVSRRSKGEAAGEAEGSGGIKEKVGGIFTRILKREKAAE